MFYNRYGSKFLKGFRDYRVKPRLTAEVIQSFLQSLDCPRALTVWLLYAHNEHSQLAALAFDPHDYNDVISMRDAYAATLFLSKFKDLLLDYDLDEVALEKFQRFEELCRSTNRRFRNLSTDPLYSGSVVWLHHAVIRKIEKILGTFSSEEFIESPDWGPGASTLIKRRRASSQEKFQCETGVTRDLYTLFPNELMEKIYPLWAHHLKSVGYPTFQVGNRVVTVPKDAATNRVIAIEPGINLWFQKSIGEMIRRKLLRLGIDLTDQSRNQELARIGSISGAYATVDLSSASDSIATSVVEALIPQPWLSVLDSCRTKYGTLKSKQLRWEKFSSMGNGFTFPLQSLIFFAIASCCRDFVHSDSQVSVYGDDIIIPISAFKLFSEALTFYGFRLNEKKSFYDSTFRESCGAHYASGVDLKPIFLKEELSSVLTVFSLANAIRRLAHRRGFNFCCDSSLRRTFDHLIQSVPKSLRFRIPEGFGDGGFVSNFDESSPISARIRKRRYEGIEGFYIYHAAEVGKSYQDDRFGYLLSELWRMSKQKSEKSDFGTFLSRLKAINHPYLVDCRKITLSMINEVSLLDSGVEGRNSVLLHQTKVKVVKSLVRQWYNLGPWLDLD
jgi:hypothetical protein